MGSDAPVSGVGTLPYMPPEAFGPSGTLLEGNGSLSGAFNSLLGEGYDPRAWDVYSLGVLLWQLWFREPVRHDKIFINSNFYFCG